MFDKIRKCLDEFENIVNKGIETEEEYNALKYFELHLAEAIIEDECCSSKTIARVILGWTGI